MQRNTTRKRAHTVRLFLMAMAFFFMYHQPVMAENRALLVGVSRYQDRSIPSLKGVIHDTRMMSRIVKNLGFTDDQIKMLTDSQASLQAVKESMATWLVDGVDQNDRVLIYFSGHGTQIPDTNGDEEDGMDEALVPWDATVEKNKAHNLLTDDLFNHLLQAIPARETIVLVDACHSGTVTRSVSFSPNPLQMKFFPWPGVSSVGKGHFEVEEAGRGMYVALSASRDNEEALTDRQKGSLFTQGMATAIKESNSRDLSLHDLETQITSFIHHYLDKRDDRTAQVHHPQLSGNHKLAGINLFIEHRSAPLSRKYMW